MNETQYSEAAVEVLDILNYTAKEDVAKIPKSFIRFLKDISSKSYKANFNYEQPINGFNLRKQTKELLGFIYITWWCNNDEYKRYKKIIHENSIKREKIKEIYNVNEIFKTRKDNEIETKIVEYRKQSTFKKILIKILEFFNIKKGDRG